MTASEDGMLTDARAITLKVKIVCSYFDNYGRSTKTVLLTGHKPKWIQWISTLYRNICRRKNLKMRKTKFQRLTAFVLSVMLVIGSLSICVFAAEAGDTQTDSGNNSSVSDSTLADIKELLNAISYSEYLEKHSNVSWASEEIFINATNEANMALDKTDAEWSIREYDGVKAVYTPSTGSVSWKVNVPKTGKYNIIIEYYAVEGKAAGIERILKINDSVPFKEARYLTLAKNWRNDYVDAVYEGKTSSATVKSEGEAAGLEAYEEGGSVYFKYPEIWTQAISDFCQKYTIRFFRRDINGNELRPTAVQTPEWKEYTLKDSSGYYSSAFEFVFEQGESVITIEGKNEPMAIKSITLAPSKEIPTYAEYIKKYESKPNGTSTIKLEGELNSYITDKTMFAIEDRSSAATSPADVSRTVLNTFGGEKWQTAGQAVSYEFKVDSDGLYDIVTRFRQNILDGMYVNRSMYIYSEGLSESDEGYYNGSPFAEANALIYNYSSDWQTTKLTDGRADGSYKIYLKAGVKYRLVFEVTLGQMGDIITTVQTSLDRINNDYLTILQLTGTSPDKYRDYSFSRIMPDNLIDMVIQADALDEVAQTLTDLAGTKSSNVGTLQKVSNLLRTMGRDEDQIARNLKRLKSYIGTLGTFLSDAKTQPLQVDYILIQSPESEMPVAKPNFFVSMFHEIKSFFWSFFRDYDSMGALDNTTNENIEVWLASGRDQSQVIRNLINNDFTPEEGVSVNLKLVAAGTLLPSILAHQGPDVYHGLSQDDVINYAIRSAILPIDGFSDFNEVTNSFTESAMLVLGIENVEGDMHYYGLPETQSFPMMFVRTDILADLNLEIPKTWDDIQAAIPVLQSQNMEIGLTTEYKIFLYQMGGDLFADGGMRINLDSKVGLESFERMCEMFTKYKFPYVYDAANRFRTGEMPILIGDYTALYNQLKVFATEIEGFWQFVPLPGIVNSDGSINNSSVSAVSAIVMVKDSEKNADSAWKYMKWYTGAQCQADYTNEMVAIMGPSAKHPTANKYALESLPWTADEYKQISTQFNSLAAVPNYPGTYIIARYTNFAFLAAYNDKADPSESLLSYIPTINKEISRKRDEFGLETLEQGQTLAAKRLSQARDAADELLSRYSSYSDTVTEIKNAISSEDLVSIKEMSVKVMTLTDESNAVNIKLNPDIKNLNDKQLLYYISVALLNAADAMATY